VDTVRRVGYILSMGGVDALTGRYRLPCPATGSSSVRLSSFREIERLPGTAHPAVYRVAFACTCGGEHVALVGHDALDWGPLGLTGDLSYVNLMTSHADDLSDELRAIASSHIGRGAWPWSFYCYLEGAPRPVTPSAFRFLVPCLDAVGVAASCPTCGSTSVNLVSESHVDVPFHSDAHVGVVTHVFSEDALRTMAEFTAELGSATFDEKRLLLDG
jgi:hypothetical protein